MPSAANMKIDKQVSSESALPESSSSGNNSTTPIRQAVTVIEHKIRNLEKRKSKLESYKELQNAGKELNGDQKSAVSKFGEVVSTLDFARDLCRQILNIAVVSEKEAKKLAKKELSLKKEAELARLREILLVQDALCQMGNETVREDFLHGRNGAAQLSENDLKLLDDVYPAVTPKHEVGNPTAFTNEVQSAAEHLLAIVDGKPKEVFGGSYSQVKEVLGKIHESGYFDQVCVEEGAIPADPLAIDEQPQVSVEPTTVLANNEEPEEVVTSELAIQSLTIEARVDQVPAVTPVIEAVPLEQPAVFYQPAPPRPITEMLGTGSFFFLQESELDTPVPEQIPSQTFTNQSYVTAPPPPIPLPPQFQGIPSNVPASQSLPIQPTREEPPYEEQPQPAQKGHNARAAHPRQANNGNNYYNNNNSNNNNGFNNRPRQRNGPRTASARHN